MHSFQVDKKDKTAMFLHRDIKPQNMLLDSSRTILKLCDFGLAKFTNTSGNTTRVGTLLYIAPEVIRSERYNDKADVYSWTVAFWECLSRRIPFGFDGMINPEISEQIRSKDLKLDKISEIPDELNNLCSRGANPDSNKRPSIKYFKNELEKFAQKYFSDDWEGFEDFITQKTQELEEINFLENTEQENNEDKKLDFERKNNFREKWLQKFNRIAKKTFEELENSRLYFFCESEDCKKIQKYIDKQSGKTEFFKFPPSSFDHQNVSIFLAHSQTKSD